MLDSEDASSGEFCNFGEERRAVELFRSTIAITKRVVDADGIELGVGFLDEALDVALVVPTVIIPSIGKNQQGTFRVVCSPHLAEAEINGVEQRGAALGSGEKHAALQVFHAVGEGAGQLGTLVETDQEEFVQRI